MSRIVTPAPVLSENQPALYPPMGYIIIPRHHSHFIAYYNEVVYIQAADNCTDVHLNDGKSHFMCRTLKSFEQELPCALFFRCHKSYLVNLSYIREVQRQRGVVNLTNGLKIEVSRRCLPKLVKHMKINKTTDYSTYHTIH